MFYVYIIQSTIKNYRYIGHTSDINKRLKQHNSGHTRSTKLNKPYKLIYLERHNSKKEAYKKEMQLKSYKGGNALNKLIKSWGGGVV